MKRWQLLGTLFAVGLAAALGCLGSTPPPEPIPAPATIPTPDDEPKIDVPDEDLKELAKGNNEFAIELFKKIAETEKGNIVISPYSIRTALAMGLCRGTGRNQGGDEEGFEVYFAG